MLEYSPAANALVVHEGAAGGFEIGNYVAPAPAIDDRVTLRDARIRDLHEAYRPTCAEMCRKIAEKNTQIERLLAATNVMTPDLLAAIAQVEGAGNPVARTYWRWSWTRQPFEMYRPASSSVGMYQMTDGTFAEARRLCIRDHAVVEDGPWSDWRSCWFNSLYTRIAPGDAVELTSAYLDRSVASILERHRMPATPLARKQELATLIHLCGAGAGDEYARRSFRLAPGQRCGDQDPRVYLSRVEIMRQEFSRLAIDALRVGSRQ